MTKEEKLVVINSLAEQIKAYPHFYVADIEALNAEQTAALRRQRDMGRQSGLAQLGGDGRRDDRGAVAVAGVVLHDEHRAHTALLAAHHGAEIGVVYVAASDIRIHKVHTPPQEVPEGYVLRSLPLSHAAAGFIRRSAVNSVLSRPVYPMRAAAAV